MLTQPLSGLLELKDLQQAPVLLFPSRLEDLGLLLSQLCVHIHLHTETVVLITCPTHQCELAEQKTVGGTEDPTGNSRCPPVARSQISF